MTFKKWQEDNIPRVHGFSRDDEIRENQCEISGAKKAWDYQAKEIAKLKKEIKRLKNGQV